MTSNLDRFTDLKKCLLFTPDEKQSREIVLENARYSQDQVILKISGCDDRNSAEALRGCLLSVKREQAIILPPDHWFVCDLIGCAVFDETEGFLGLLSDILQNGAQDVYTVHLDGQKDLLFPAVKSVLQNVDIVGRRMDVRLPNGLYEVYRGRNT